MKKKEVEHTPQGELTQGEISTQPELDKEKAQGGQPDPIVSSNPLKEVHVIGIHAPIIMDLTMLDDGDGDVDMVKVPILDDSNP